jgi:pyruvate,orthophosphate dikinase
MKYVYFFGNGQADGGKDDRDLLGGKGADLQEMSRLGVNVPPGFTITTEACRLFMEEGGLPEVVRQELHENLDRLEEVRGKKLGDSKDPLLVSVRSGAVFSMPGMMDTVLNLGCNRAAVEALATLSGDRRFALDSYRRLIQMFTNVVKKVRLEAFEEILDEAVEKAGVPSDAELPAEYLEEVVDLFLKHYEEAVGSPFPEDPREQIEGAVHAVFDSWNTPRARKYRQLHDIPDHLGTACNVQSMVFGNLNDMSGAGVVFTRDPATGEKALFGEWLIQAQGEDVVAGVRTPLPMSAPKDGGDVLSLETKIPAAYQGIEDVARRLEEHYADMLDMEFTVEDGQLFILQSRRGKRTGTAAVQIAVDLEEEGLLDAPTAITRVEPGALDQLLHPRVESDAGLDVMAEGLPASPGAACGIISFSADEVEELTEKGEKCILVRPMTVADDVGGMAAAVGLLTARGGMTSHAAVVARGMGTPCVAGAGALNIDEKAGKLSASGFTLKAGEQITIDGTSGKVYPTAVPLVEPQITGAADKLMGWADEFRRMKVRTNADNGHDARRAREFGAQGIGLCRTEHMFFAPERLAHVQQMILAQDEETRAAALAELEPMQRADFVELFEAMDGLPVTIRLLDPPLHEFLPHRVEEYAELSERLGESPEALHARAEILAGENPMMGHRGVRVGITTPEVYMMQTEAILRAAAEAKAAGAVVVPEIMIPLVAAARELAWIKENVYAPSCARVEETGELVPHMFGVMIETPRACLDAGAIAEHAEFFSFGTNDLTQFAYAFSRDDSAQFFPDYLSTNIMESDPFEHVDQFGVGELARMALERGRATRPDLKVGVCGEHGGDPQSVIFWDKVGLDYVSCSPFRVPGARLAAAQAAVSGKASYGGTR